MNILVTGSEIAFTPSLLEKFNEGSKITLYGKGADRVHVKNVTAYDFSDEQEKLSRLFVSGKFEQLIYFSYATDGNPAAYDEFERFEKFMYAASRRHVQKVIYVTANDAQKEDPSGNSRYILLNACEQMARQYAVQYHIKVAVLRVPYLYDAGPGKSQLRRWIRSAVGGETVSLDGSAGTVTDFLAMDDLGELIFRLLNYQGREDTFHVYNVSGNNECSFGKLEDELKKLVPGVQVSSRHRKASVPCCVNSPELRELFGWQPLHTLSADMEAMKSSLQAEKAEPKKKKKSGKIRRTVFEILECVVTVFFANYLNTLISGNVFLEFMDFRLLAVLLLASVNGMAAGVFSALLACVCYFAGNSSSLTLSMIFFNVENWLPFAFYILLGTIVGYTKNKYMQKAEVVKERYDLLADKYDFLNRIYTEVLESEETYFNQILGYRDSYGRIYSIIQKLNTTVNDQIFMTAVDVLEDVLDNRTVAIYSIQKNSGFARLTVSSASIGDRIPKSLKLDDVQKMVSVLLDNRTFANVRGMKGYPAYAAPLLQHDELIGMVFVMDAGEEQINMEFSNKLFIISSLITQSLVHAMELDSGKEYALENTRILNRENFRQSLELRKKMQQKNYSDFTLISVIPGIGEDIREQYGRILPLVRNSDVIGIGEDGSLQILLLQTDRKQAQIVAERFRKAGIGYHIVSPEGEKTA